ncbi:YcaO-like family protein [Candidatus Saccharibacteria bacterium]|nr:YcaO-like family protein [Candidatus Saccharibacteria bacterium]
MLLERAADNRHGVTFETQMAVKSQSDLKSLYHAGVPSSVLAPWESASGGVSRNQQSARLAAIGESIERYSAATVQLPTFSFESAREHGANILDFSQWPLFTDDQRVSEHFPFGAIYDKPTTYVQVRSLADDRLVFVPQPLVVLRDDFETGLPTSSGLAAAPHARAALLSALLELVERDALMVTWLNGLAGHRIALPETYADEVASLNGIAYAFDITPVYSPYPVIAVCGQIKKDGRPRFSLGVACKTTLAEATEKAYHEWHQGVFFAGIFSEHADTDHIATAVDVNTFDDHAVYYSLFPDQWDSLPLLQDMRIKKPRYDYPTKKPTVQNALKTLKIAFKRAAIRSYYVDVSGVDAFQSGVRVIRAVSPDLAMIFAHQSWPLLKHVDTFRKSRYPKNKPLVAFPNHMPHPLG